MSKIVQSAVGGHDNQSPIHAYDGEEVRVLGVDENRDVERKPYSKEDDCGCDRDDSPPRLVIPDSQSSYDECDYEGDEYELVGDSSGGKGCQNGLRNQDRNRVCEDENGDSSLLRDDSTAVGFPHLSRRLRR